MSIKCPVCDNRSHIIFLYKRKGYDIYKCRICGLGITEIPENFNLLDIYTEDYYQGGQDDGYSDYLGSENALRLEFRKDVNILKRYSKLGDSLLEIGSAYGFFLKEAKDFFDVKGLEVSNAAVEYCRKNGQNVFQGILTEDIIDRLSSKFKVIVFLDVIEHISNPNEFFYNLEKITSKGSLLMLTTGNFSSFFSRLLGKYWRLMTPPQHVFFYSKKSLVKLLKKYGYEIIHISSPSKLVPLGLILYQLNRMIGIKIFKTKSNIPLNVNLFDTIKIIAKKLN